jgi:hypothetical protein
VAVALAMEHASAEIDDLIFDRLAAFGKAALGVYSQPINRRRPGASFLQSPRGRVLMADVVAKVENRTT